MSSQPDCAKCAADNQFALWLEANDVAADDAMTRERAVQAAAEALFIYNTTEGLHFVIHSSDGGYADIAQVALDAAEPILSTRVWAHWVQSIRARVCAEEGHNVKEVTGLGSTEQDFICARCGHSWSQPYPKVCTCGYHERWTSEGWIERSLGLRDRACPFHGSEVLQ
jgi:hypothetical protein